MKEPEFVFARKYNPERGGDESKVVGVEGYIPPTPVAVELMDTEELQANLRMAGLQLLQMSEAYLELREKAQQSSLLKYQEMSKLREHYRPTCQHKWGESWHETNHKYRRCEWCWLTEKRKGGGAWAGD